MASAKRNTARPVIIHGIADARAACRAAMGRGEAVTLWSARGAGGYMGPLWFAEIIRQTRGEFPTLTITGVLDCDAAPGDALAAIRVGVQAIALTAKPTVKARIRNIASAENAILLRRPAKALDLQSSADPEAYCRRWFGIRDG